MKQFDDEGLFLCTMQGNVFVASLETMNCSSPVFIRRFMNSYVAERMDRPGFIYGAEDVINILEAVDEQYGPSEYGKEKFDQEEMFWIGYLYRYWAYTYEKSSSHIYRLIRPKELRELYYPYHSLDPSQAIERILESRNLLEEEDITARGVRVLREIRSRERNKGK